MLYILFISLTNFAGIFCLLLYDFPLDFFALNTSGESGQNTPHDAPEQSNPDNASGQGNSQGGDNKPPKRPKPSLFLDLSRSDAQKDNDRMASCEHTSYTVLASSSDYDVENVYCDFNPENNEAHKAFDSSRDLALSCRDCHAVLCKHCGEEYTDEFEEYPYEEY